MSTEELRAALAAGPTPGPWTAKIPSGEDHYWARDAYISAPNWGYVARVGIDATLPHWDGPQRANAAYIAAACNAAPSLLAELDALKAERDALRADAERYRWLRDKTHKDWECFNLPTVWFAGPTSWKDQTLDGAIDAALKDQA